MGASRRQGRCSDKDSLCGNYEAQWETKLENPVRDFLCNVILNLKSSIGNITFYSGVQRRHLYIICLSAAPSTYQRNVGVIEAYSHDMPIAVAERSKARTVFARSNTAIVGSNPTEAWMFVCILCAFSLCLHSLK
jgi:hypothetical protein